MSLQNVWSADDDEDEAVGRTTAALSSIAQGPLGHGIVVAVVETGWIVVVVVVVVLV